MKKCGSTASKSLELGEATNSISIDGARTPVVQREEEQSSQHFSLRRCENCVSRVVRYSPSADQRLNVEETSLQICNPVPSSVEHRAGGDGIAGDSYKAPIEVIILDDSEDEEVVKLTVSLEKLAVDEEKVSAGNRATTITPQKTEKRPCLDESKNIIIELEDDGEEFDRKSQETRKAIGELSRPWGDTKVEDNDQTSGTLEPSQNLNRGSPFGQAVLDDLNAKIASTANTLRNQQQQRRNISSNSTLDLSLSLCIPGTEGNQKVKDEGISVESQRKRKGTFDAFDNVSVSSVKARRRMEMGKFLEKPFTSCEIIDLESANTDGSTRPVTTAYAKHGPTPRKYAKATGESSRPREDEHKGPVKKSGTGANPRVGNMLNMEAPQIGRPLIPIDEVCILNRNPADFSKPGSDNIYMIEHL